LWVFCLNFYKTFKRPYSDFIKAILRLCNVDAQLNYGYKYHPSFKRLSKHLPKEHIVHLCMKYRLRSTLTKKEKDNFLLKVKEYVGNFK